MKKIAIIIASVFVLATNVSADEIKNGKIQQKTWWRAKGVYATGDLQMNPQKQNCSGIDDLMLSFNISEFREKYGGNFDPDNIYVYALDSDGKNALNKWLDSWQSHQGERSLPPLGIEIQGTSHVYDFTDQNSVDGCIGVSVWPYGLLPSNNFQKIILWYDSGNTMVNYPNPFSVTRVDAVAWSPRGDNCEDALWWFAVKSENGKEFMIPTGKYVCDQIENSANICM